MNGMTSTALSNDHCTPPMDTDDHEGMYRYLSWLMAKHGIKSGGLNHLKNLYNRNNSSNKSKLLAAAVHLTDNANKVRSLQEENPNEYIVAEDDYQKLLHAIRQYRKTRS